MIYTIYVMSAQGGIIVQSRIKIGRNLVNFV